MPDYVEIYDKNNERAMFIDTVYDTGLGKQTTNIDASVSNYLDLISYEGVRLKETDTNSIMMQANSTAITMNKPVLVDPSIGVGSGNQLVSQDQCDARYYLNSDGLNYITPPDGPVTMN